MRKMRRMRNMRSSVVEWGASRRRSWRQSLCYPHPWDQCEPWGTAAWPGYPTVKTRPLLDVLGVLRVQVFQFCTCLWRGVFSVLRVLCVLLDLCVLCALCALHAFSKPYVQHHWQQKGASSEKRTDGRQRNIDDVKRYVYILMYSVTMHLFLRT